LYKIEYVHYQIFKLTHFQINSDWVSQFAIIAFDISENEISRVEVVNL